MTTSMRLLLTCALVVLGAAVFAQAGWLPPQVEQGIAQQLTEHLSSLESGDGAPPAAVADSARNAVKAIAAVLGSWTDAVVVERAPAFPQIALPATENPVIQAMTAYHMCTMEDKKY